MAIKYILLLIYIFVYTPLYCDDDIINAVDENFKKSTKNKIDKIAKSGFVYEKKSFLDIISKEIWASVEANSPSKIYPQDLQKDKEIKKIAYKKEAKNYRGTIDYINSIIDKEFTNYLSWVIIIQSFVIMLFIILYIDINWKIKKLQSKRREDLSIDKEISKEKNNLRKALL